MKSLLITLFIFITVTATAQLKATVVCPPITVDALGGRVNSLHTKSTPGEITKALTCFNEISGVDSIGQCNNISDKTGSLLFFPARNYIEIRENFKGILKPALLGASRGSLFKTLGHPKLKDVNWEAFQTEYGIMVLYYNKAGKINKIQMSSKSTETLKLCETN